MTDSSYLPQKKEGALIDQSECCHTTARKPTVSLVGGNDLVQNISPHVHVTKKAIESRQIRKRAIIFHAE